MFERIKKIFNRQPEQPAIIRHEVAAIDETTAAMIFAIMRGESHFIIIGRDENAHCAIKDMDYKTLFNALQQIAEDDKEFKQELTNWVIDLNR